MDEVTYYCSLWKLGIPAGESLFLTDHDDVILFEGDTYLPQNPAEAMKTEMRSGLSVDSGGIQTRLMGSNLTQQDIIDGALDGASLSHFRYDWQSGEIEILSKGRVGEISFRGTTFSLNGWVRPACWTKQRAGYFLVNVMRALAIRDAG